MRECHYLFFLSSFPPKNSQAKMTFSEKEERKIEIWMKPSLNVEMMGKERERKGRERKREKRKKEGRKKGKKERKKKGGWKKERVLLHYVARVNHDFFLDHFM